MLFEFFAMYMYYLMPKKITFAIKFFFNERTLREHTVALKERNRLRF